MDPPNVLWFFGAFAIAFATLTLIDKVPESGRDGAATHSGSTSADSSASPSP